MADLFQQALRHDSLLAQHFQALECIGEGAQGRVVRAICTIPPAERLHAGVTYALKLVLRRDLNSVSRVSFERELINHSSLQHPHIVGYKCFFVTLCFFVVVMEYVECAFTRRVESLTRIVPSSSGLEPKLAKFLFQQLVLAVEYCHKRGVANRDIKLEHCLLSGPTGGGGISEIKLCDWGLSKADFSMPAVSGVGTPGYWAPEVIICGWTKTKYDGKVADSFSVGVVLYNLLFGRRNFPPVSGFEFDVLRTDNPQELYENALARRAFTLRPEDLPQGVEISMALLEVLKGLLQGNPRERWSMDDVIRTPWFQDGLPEQAKDLNQRLLMEQPTSKDTDDVRNRVVRLIDQVLSQDG